MSICFVSDLHLFSARSRAGEYMEVLHRRARQSSHMVLGGDLFDFKWSTLDDVGLTCDAAISWLEELLEVGTACKFILLLGNHDDHPQLVERLMALSLRQPRFHWERYWCQMGDVVFLHGDAANPFATARRLRAARMAVQHHRRRGMLMNALYTGTVRLRLHVIGARMVFPNRLVARRLARYLGEEGIGPGSGVRRVYFGHTHLAMAGFQHGGMTFYNGGAPIAGLTFEVLDVGVA
jgi:UDP-2,3-diacylglucosamine hydrolase